MPRRQTPGLVRVSELQIDTAPAVPVRVIPGSIVRAIPVVGAVIPAITVVPAIPAAMMPALPTVVSAVPAAMMPALPPITMADGFDICVRSSLRDLDWLLNCHRRGAGRFDWYKCPDRHQNRA